MFSLSSAFGGTTPAMIPEIFLFLCVLNMTSCLERFSTGSYIAFVAMLLLLAGALYNSFHVFEGGFIPIALFGMVFCTIWFFALEKPN